MQVLTPTLELDLKYVWHPFTQAKTFFSPLVIHRALGAYLFSEDDTPYLDAVSSWWVNLHGHSHPCIVRKIQEQAEKLDHVMFAGMTHMPAVELAEKLITLTHGHFSKVFFSDNGSTAIEAAIKIALQYFYNNDPHTRKKTIVCLKGSYHGDTFGAMSASGKNNFNKPFWSHLFEVKTISIPYEGSSSLEELETLLKSKEVAAFIFEPLILGVGGMLIYPAATLSALIELCHSYGVLTIADEVMTGFGRTGPIFASEKLSCYPDMLCVAKGLTGGSLTLSAILCKEHVYERFYLNEHSKAFLHGHSYTANPISCAAALANLDLLIETACSKQRVFIEDHYTLLKDKISHHPSLRRVEFLGTIFVIEFESSLGSYEEVSIRDALYEHFLKHHIIVRPLGPVLYFMPPYCVTKEDLNHLDHTLFTFMETL